MGVTISGMTGRGSIRHNNRSFSAANIDRSRTGLNVTFCQEDLKQVYHQVFDEALAAYNAKKKKTRDKIPDYYEHIRQGKQEKLFHEVIFQIGNKDDCGCGSLDGDRAAAVLKEFAESFQERNPHLRVFNAVLHMDEATPPYSYRLCAGGHGADKGTANQGFHETGPKAVGLYLPGPEHDRVAGLDGEGEADSR